MNDDHQAMHAAPVAAVAQEAERWLARLHAPDCSPADRRRFQDWLALHATHWQAYHQAERLWDAAAQARDPEMDALADAVLRRARRRGTVAPRRFRALGWAAAVIVIAGTAAGLMIPRAPAPEPVALTYGTAIGEIRTVTLPDDSAITLDTDTAVQVRISQHARVVTLLRGKAQFKVAHDPARPFTVDTPLIEVTDVGTVFQVRNLDGTSAVSLLQGRVYVDPAPAEKGQAQREELMPGDRLVAKPGAAWQRTRVDVAAAQGWLSGQLVFHAMPLRQAVEEFNRYSQRKLQIADPAVGNLLIQGVFNAGDTDAIMLALRTAYPLRAEDRGSRIVLRHR